MDDSQLRTFRHELRGRWHALRLCTQALETCTEADEIIEFTEAIETAADDVTDTLDRFAFMLTVTD